MKKRFIFDEAFNKKHAQKGLTKWLIISLSIILLIVLIVIIFLVTRTHQKAPVSSKPIYEFKENMVLEAGSPLPNPIDYFTKIQNVDLNTIKVEYPESFEISYDTSSCSAEDIEKINDKENYNIADFSCAKASLNNLNSYGVKVSVNDDTFTVNLTIVDTMAPNLVTKDLEIYEGEQYTVDDFLVECSDITGECQVEFADEESQNHVEIGSHEVKIRAKDSSNNISESTVTLNIIEVNSKYTITFDTDGGSPVDSLKITKGGVFFQPQNPTKEGYEFKGWYLDDQAYDFTKPVESDITLKAKWEEITPNIPDKPIDPVDPNENKYIDVSSVSINYQKIYLYIGESKTVVARVKPENATNKTVTWSSSDSSIASVDNGKITGLKEGTAIITATAGNKSSTMTVTVVSQNTTSCTYGDTNYNHDYILSVNLISNNCAANPNRSYNELNNAITRDLSSALNTLSSMGFKINDAYGKLYEHNYEYLEVYNTSGKGLVGYQLTMTLRVYDVNASSQILSAKYIINPDGSRQFLSNNITRNNLTFK